MEFSAAPGANYQVAPFPGQPDANVEVASSMKVGQPMAFKLSGEGTLAAPADENGQPSQGSSAQNESRPGGGLGPPIDAPDPLQKYRWWILGGFAAVLIVGGVFVASRQQAANRAARARGRALPSLEEDEDYAAADPPGREIHTSEARLSESRPQPAAPRRSSTMLLEALKEEIFELEVEHKQGRISQQEYESAKAALDQTSAARPETRSPKSLAGRVEWDGLSIRDGHSCPSLLLLLFAVALGRAKTSRIFSALSAQSRRTPRVTRLLALSPQPRALPENRTAELLSVTTVLDVHSSEP